MKPCVFVGMGGTGARMIGSLYRKMEQKYTKAAMASAVGKYYHFCVFDTDTKASNKLPQNVKYFQLPVNASVQLKLLSEQPDAEICKWLPPNFFSSNFRTDAAGQVPPLALIALCDHLAHSDVNDWVTKTVVAPLLKVNTLDYATTTPDGSTRYTLPMVFMGGISGGSGSGLVVHLPFLLRQLFAKAISPELAQTNAIMVQNIAILAPPEEMELVRPVTRRMRAISYATAMSLDFWQMLPADRVKGQTINYDFVYQLPGELAKVKISENPPQPYDIIFWAGRSTAAGKSFTKDSEWLDTTTDFIYAGFCGSNTANAFMSQLNNIPNTEAGGYVSSLAYPDVKRPRSYGSFITGRLQFPKKSIRSYLANYVAGRWRAEKIDREADSAYVTTRVKTIFDSAHVCNDEDKVKIDVSNERGLLQKISSAKSSADLDQKTKEYTEELLAGRLRAKKELHDGLSTQVEGIRISLERELATLITNDNSDVSGISLLRGIPQTADALLDGMMGDRNDPEGGGLYGNVREVLQRINRITEQINICCSKHYSTGFLTSGDFKKAKNIVIEQLRQLHTAYEEDLLFNKKIEILGQIKTDWVGSVRRASELFHKLLDEKLVPGQYPYAAVGLPSVQAENEKAGVMVPVFYEKTWIQERWLKGWMEPMGQTVNNKTVIKRYQELNESLMGTSEKRKGPLSKAMQDLWTNCYNNSNWSDEEIQLKSEEDFNKAREVLESSVCTGDFNNWTVWDAVQEEAKEKARLSKNAVLDEVRAILLSFMNRLSPLWTPLGEGGITGVNHNEPYTLLMGPPRYGIKEKNYDFPQNHLLHKDRFDLESIGIKDDSSDYAGKAPDSTSWKSFLLVVKCVYGYPLANLFSFEEKGRSAYEAEELWVNKQGAAYLHTDYKYRHLYHYLAFERDQSVEADSRRLIVACEYIQAKKVKFFQVTNDDDTTSFIPTIEKTGDSAYRIITNTDAKNIKGRENLYSAFADDPALREEVAKRVDEWLSSVPKEKKDLLSAMTKWAEARSRKAAEDGVAANIAAAYKKDAEAVKTWS